MRNLKYVAIFVITFIVVLILMLLLFQPNKTSGLKKAPGFKITTFEGKKISLNLLADKVVVVNFWASWCPPCRQEAPELEKVWRNYKNQIYFVGLNINDKENDAKAFIKEFDITYPNGPVSNQLGQEYSITGVPETFIIKDGLIYDHIIGATTIQELTDKIDKVL